MSNEEAIAAIHAITHYNQDKMNRPYDGPHVGPIPDDHEAARLLGELHYLAISRLSRLGIDCEPLRYLHSAAATQTVDARAMLSGAMSKVHLSKAQRIPATEKADIVLNLLLAELTKPVRTEEQTVAPPTIWFHGEQSYSDDGLNPFNATGEQHFVLNAFLDKDVALDTHALGGIVSNPASVIAKLDNKLPGFIRKPANKGEGYFIRVRTKANS